MGAGELSAEFTRDDRARQRHLETRQRADRHAERQRLPDEDMDGVYVVEVVAEGRLDQLGQPAPLGRHADGTIDTFVPGMIMTVAHPSWESDRFVRVFAALSPHTTGASRSCESCHRSSAALGLGSGEVSVSGGELRFRAAGEMLEDGLPADAWTNVGNTLGGRAPAPGQRPLNKDEMRRVLEAEL